ncbi:MAG TPA: hypothetical protein VJO33_07200 [Gemmatimonadaceae bacterium]|nr:hypothetical protein [Gemmatimonadaceae bacterium]
MASLDAHLVARVEQVFGMQRTLADLLAWAGAQTPRVQIAEIITQDEYTHDVLVPFGPTFLSFDTT